MAIGGVTPRNARLLSVNWPKTNLGFPSTSGTTASVLFVMNGKYYTGHVGDSRIVLGRSDSFNRWSSYPMTRDHKPESPKERKRIEDAGGQVMIKSGIGRVVWKRPKLNCDISFDVIPFLAVARSLGDLWSLNTQLDTFVVSPEPDVHCVPINPLDRCLVLASDGLWNMVSSRKAIILAAETHNGGANLDEAHPQQSSTSSYLLHHCLDLWAKSRCRADNTTVLAAMFDMTDTHCGFDSNEAHFDCTDLTSTFIGDTIHSRNISYSKQSKSMLLRGTHYPLYYSLTITSYSEAPGGLSPVRNRIHNGEHLGPSLLRRIKDRESVE